MASDSLARTARSFRSPRTPQACNPCRQNKTKCDGLMPCAPCGRRGKECIYQLFNDGGWATLAVDNQEPDLQSGNVSSPSGPLHYEPTVVTEHLPHAEVPLSNSHSAVLNATNDSVERSTAVTTTPSSAQPTELVDVNKYTNNVEFYGSTSSMNFLRLAERSRNIPSDISDVEEPLISSLNNPEIDKNEHAQRFDSQEDVSDYFSGAARRFLDGYFHGIHYAHPFLNMRDFLQRCQLLWRHGRGRATMSFIALYYSVLSFGALMMVWPGDERIDGEGRFEWSRKLFHKARDLAETLNQTTDLETVQCFFFLAKVCQNEISPHIAYIYIGRAVRTALAMGINRHPAGASKTDSEELSRAKTRTWWALYSLEIEISCSVGRPDSLGNDVYHNRPFPRILGKDTSEQIAGGIEPAEVEIIAFLVDLSRITREISTRLYLPVSNISIKVEYARAMEEKLDIWLQSLPFPLRPSKYTASSGSFELVRQPSYIRKQRLLLGTKYHNVRTLLHASFIGADQAESSSTQIVDSFRACAESAKLTIELIYETYCHQDFFRTWWYNTTYTIFAATVILFYISQNKADPESLRWYELVQNAIAILRAMDESIVARKAATIVERCLQSVEENPTSVYLGETGFQEIMDTWLENGELDPSFPFDVTNWDGNGIFPWVNFGY